MAKREVRKFDRALQNIELSAERIRTSQVNALHPEGAVGASPLDVVSQGQLMVIYADARAVGSGAGTVTAALNDLRSASRAAAALKCLARQDALAEAAMRLLPANFTSNDSATRSMVAVEITGIAGLLITRREIEMLEAISGAIPAVAIAARSRITKRPRADFHYLVGSFPGQYLGTRAVSGTG